MTMHTLTNQLANILAEQSIAAAVEDEAATDRLSDQEHETLAAICATPAASMADVFAKIKALGGILASEPDGLCSRFIGDDFIRSLLKDAQRLGGQ
jgi:hypothetical protein